MYEVLLQKIISGAFAPGEPLGEERLAAELEVSRTPLREAIRKLAEEGFVEYTPFKGARVVTPTAELVKEVFLIREALEGLAAREAARQASRERLQSLRAHFERLQPLILAGHVNDIGDTIHQVTFAECNNKRLLQMMSGIRGQVQWFQQMATRVPGRLLPAFREHESILRALEAGDPEWAESAARAHIRNTLRDLLDSLDTAGRACPGSELPAGERK